MLRLSQRVGFHSVEIATLEGYARGFARLSLSLGLAAHKSDLTDRTEYIKR